MPSDPRRPLPSRKWYGPLRSNASLQAVAEWAPLAGVACILALMWLMGGEEPPFDARVRARPPGSFHPLVEGIFAAVLGAGAIFGAIGLFRLVATRDSQEEHRRSAKAPDPWLSDHPWRRYGAADELLRRDRRHLRDGLAGLAFGCGCAVVTLRGGAPRSFALGFFVVWGFIMALPSLAMWARRAHRRAKYGRLALRFRRFPFLLGGPFEATLVRTAGAPVLGPLEATLVCVQEMNFPPRQRPGCVEVWSETLRVDGVAPDATSVAMRFDLPHDPRLSTELSADLARYWELWVSWQDLRGQFLVPVYAPPLETVPVPAR